MNAIFRFRLPAAAFVVAAVYVPGIFSAGHMPRWWAMAVLVPLASDLDPRNLDPRVGFCLLAGLAWAAVTLLWTPIPAEGALDLYFMVLLAGVMLAAAGQDVDRAVAAFGWGLFGSSCVAVLQRLGVQLDIPTSAGGPAGLFLNQEIFAEVAAPLAAWAFWRRRWGLVAVGMVPVLISGSRIAAAAVCLGFLVGWRPKVPWARSVLVTALGAAAVLSIFAFGTYKAGTGLTRVVLWLSGVQALTPAGLGLGWWAVGHPGPMEEYAHSDVLQLAVELGVGSAFLLAVPVIVIWKGSGDVAERSAFACLCLEAAFSFPLHSPAAAFLAALLAGGMARRRRDVRLDEHVGGTRTLSDVRRAAPARASLVLNVLERAAHLSGTAPSANGDQHLARVGCAPPGGVPR